MTFLPICSETWPFPTLARYPAVRHQDRHRRQPWVDLWPGIHGRPDQARLLLLPFSLQAQAGELRKCAVAAHQLHLPAGLGGHGARLQDLRLPLVSSAFPTSRLGFTLGVGLPSLSWMNDWGWGDECTKKKKTFSTMSLKICGEKKKSTFVFTRCLLLQNSSKWQKQTTFCLQ